MGKLLVLASGVVTAPRLAPKAVSAYVALSAGAQSRVFRVRGPVTGPAVDELPAATTLDIKRFQLELREDLQPALDDLRTEGHPAHIEVPSPEMVAGFVRDHLKKTEGLDVA